MWVNSKQAAEILGVNNKSVEKAAFRSKNAGKKFCTIKSHICYFEYIDGNRGGAAGKTLQIWIEDKNSEISRADKASAVNLVNTASVRPLNFTNGESDGYIYADTKLDARDSVDIRGANGGVFGAGFAHTSGGRDQEQTQINSNQRTNDGHEHKTAGYGTDGGEYNGIDTRGNGGRASDGRNQRSDASDSSYEQDDERGEAKAYSDAYAGDGVYECQDNKQRGLRLQAGSESQRGANGIAVKDEAIECEVVDEQGGLNLSGAGEANLPAIATCSDKKRKSAFEKYDVIKAWEDAKGKIGEAAFLEYINARKICCVKVTANKLYDWQRKYKRGGLDALVDERDNNKTLKLDALGLAPLCVELILACGGMGKVDITNIYKSLNYHAIKNSLINFEDFQGKKDEVVSYEVVNRFVNNYLNKNKLVKNIILYGEDGAVGRGLPALGISNYAVSTINEVVEIDGSPLDLICNASDLCDLIGWQNVSAIFKDKNEFESYVKEWQKRYTIIALIDTYSGVATFHISETENSLAIARAVAKYIVRYGKPKVIKGDNGKAFKSEYMREVLGALEIEYKAVKAYSGWPKPYVEGNF